MKATQAQAQKQAHAQASATAAAAATDAAATATRPARVTEWREHAVVERADWLAEEVPVALVINGISHAVMLASPCDLEDFALGFALTEGLIASRAELYGVEMEEVPEGIELQMQVSSACAWRLQARRRMLAGRTGCGLCGAERLAQVTPDLPRAPEVWVSPAALARAQHELQGLQSVQQLTGATHAAAWCALSGEVRLAREDVGRHNALDKLVGAMVRAAEDPTRGFVALTSRASVEMVHKSVAAGVGLIAAVSGPTALAVRRAEALGLALAGFVRGADGVAYTFAERFGLQAHG